MKTQSILALFVLALLGCGGADHDTNQLGNGALAANPYATFGYSQRFYVGTLIGSDDAAHVLNVPTVATVSEDRQTVAALGYAPPATPADLPTRASLNDSPTFEPSLTSNLSGSTTGIVVRPSGLSLRIDVTGGAGQRARFTGSLDAPSLERTGPPTAGTYEGFIVGRSGGTGALVRYVTARGQVNADGSFQFVEPVRYDDTATGTIGADGSVSSPGLAVDGRVVATDEVVAFGTADDLTVAFLRPGNQEEVFFRMHRTGD